MLLLIFVAYLFVKGAGAISWHFLTASPSASEAGGGVGPLIFNSFYILILTLVFTVPIAICAGMYLQEYAGPGRFRDLVQFSAESLATVPSIVMGLFGLLIFVQTFHWHFTALGGALTLTLLNLPAHDARDARGARERAQHVSRGVDGHGRDANGRPCCASILPSAIGPLTTGVVLIAGRIFGETAALIFTAGASVSYGAAPTTSIRSIPPRRSRSASTKRIAKRSCPMPTRSATVRRSSCSSWSWCSTSSRASSAAG